MKIINKKNNKRGITLIALVVTIIVLLILAGVSISMLVGENGMMNKTEIARERTEKSEAKEKVELMLTEWIMDRKTNGTPSLDDFLKTNGDGNKYKDKRENYDVIMVEGPEDDRYIATVVVGSKRYDVIINAEDVESPYVEDVIIAGSRIKTSVQCSKYIFEGKNLIVTAEPPSGETIKEITSSTGTAVGDLTNNSRTFSVTSSPFKYTIETNRQSKEYTKEINILRAPTITTTLGIKSVTINLTSTYPQDANVKYKYYYKSTQDYDEAPTNIITNLVPETQYTVKVLAYIDNESNGLYSQEITITAKDIEKPKVSISNITPTSFNINVTNELYSQDVTYEYYVDGAKLNNEETSEKTWSVSNKTEETCYEVKVRAKIGNDWLESEMVYAQLTTNLDEYVVKGINMVEAEFSKGEKTFYRSNCILTISDGRNYE